MSLFKRDPGKEIERLQRRRSGYEAERQSIQKTLPDWEKLSPKRKIGFGGPHGGSSGFYEEREPSGMKGEFLRDLQRAFTDEDVAKVVQHYVHRFEQRQYKKEASVKKVNAMIDELKEDGYIT